MAIIDGEPAHVSEERWALILERAKTFGAIYSQPPGFSIRHNFGPFAAQIGREPRPFFPGRDGER